MLFCYAVGLVVPAGLLAMIMGFGCFYSASGAEYVPRSIVMSVVSASAGFEARAEH